MKEVDAPAASGVTPWYADADLVDAFATDLPLGTTSDPKELANAVFDAQPGWITALLGVRDAVVRPLGIKTSKQLGADQAASGALQLGIFRVFALNEREVVLGEDDLHLDFRVSVLRHSKAATDGGSNACLVVTTVVRCHNRLGRTYLAAIKFFHRRVVIASLQHAAGRGWPAP